MTLYNYDLTLDELDIEVSNIEQAMNHDPENPSGPWSELIVEVLSEVSTHCDIHGGYTIIGDVGFNKNDHTVRLGDTVIHPDRIVYRYLKKSEAMAVFTCTAGPVGEWSKELMAKGDLLKGYVVDVIGNEIVERAMDEIETYLVEEAGKKGQGISTRYSPGYCNWNVSEQHKIFRFLPDKFCNVGLLPSGLMTPMKSISGIIGIGTDVKSMGYSCHACDDEMCIYRGKFEKGTRKNLHSV